MSVAGIQAPGSFARQQGPENLRKIAVLLLAPVINGQCETGLR